MFHKYNSNVEVNNDCVKHKEKSISINYLDYVVYHFQLYLHFKYLTQKNAFDFVNPTKFALIKYAAQVLEDFN